MSQRKDCFGVRDWRSLLNPEREHVEVGRARYIHTVKWCAVLFIRGVSRDGWSPWDSGLSLFDFVLISTYGKSGSSHLAWLKSLGVSQWSKRHKKKLGSDLYRRRRYMSDGNG